MSEDHLVVLRNSSPARCLTEIPLSFTRFRHPGCHDLRNELFRLRRTDANERNEHGVHYGTALVACGIVAGNRWNGRLSVDAAGKDLVDHCYDTVLLEHDYYFWPEGSNREPSYPVTPSFQHWVFPHQNLPPTWDDSWLNLYEDRQSPPHSQLSNQVRHRDQTCRVSGFDVSLETAHLVPASEVEWFQRNSLNNYANERLADIDDAANAVLLRSDIHKQFDDKCLVLVPKRTAIVVHVLGRSVSYAQHFHNIQLKDVYGVSKEYIFTRFAWAILAKLPPFVRHEKNQWAGILVPDEEGSRTIFPDHPDFKSFELGRSRSSSTKKRFRRNVASEVYALPKTFVPTARQPRTSPKKRTLSTNDINTLVDDEARMSKRARLMSDGASQTTTQTNSSAHSPRTPSQRRAEALKHERERSDPDGTWQQAKAWRDRVIRQEATLDERDVRALSWVDGKEDAEWEETILGAAHPESYT